MSQVPYRIRCRRVTLLAAVLMGGLTSMVLPALGGDTGSRILDSPSRSTVYRGEPVPRSIRPDDRTVSRSLGGMIGDLEAAGGLGSRQERRNDSMRIYDCVTHHERLERTTRQPFATYCDPTVDVAPGYPAFTTR